MECIVCGATLSAPSNQTAVETVVDHFIEEHDMDVSGE
jgi:predicted small metal-binding protein